MKDIKHIRQDFHWVTWVMPQGWDLGVLEGQKLNFLNIVRWHIKLKGMISRPEASSRMRALSSAHCTDERLYTLRIKIGT